MKKIMNALDKVRNAGFELVDLYGDGTAITAFNEEMDLFDDVLLFQRKEALFCTETFPVKNLIAALLLVNELNGLAFLGKWTVAGEGEERYIAFCCQFDPEKSDFLWNLLKEFAQNYMKVKRALRLFREKPLSGKTLAYCATLRCEEDDIPEEELSRIRLLQDHYAEGRLQEEDISAQDTLYLEKLFQRDCMKIKHQACKYKYPIYRASRNATKNKRKLDML